MNIFLRKPGYVLLLTIGSSSLISFSETMFLKSQMSFRKSDGQSEGNVFAKRNAHQNGIISLYWNQMASKTMPETSKVKPFE